MSAVADLLEQPLRKRQPGEIFREKRPIRGDAVPLQNEDQLPDVLRRMPGRTFEELVARLLTVVRLHEPLGEFSDVCRPPVLQPVDYLVAVCRDFIAARAGAVLWR